MKTTKSTRALLSKKSVSFPAGMYKAAEARAHELNRNFSNYLQTLVKADLAKSEHAASQSTPLVSK